MHTVKGAIDHHVYHGNTKNADPQYLGSRKIVITTYDSLRSDRNLFKRGLFAVKWRRVILDEGHIIRNKNTQVAQAACMLQAERRIVLSGTPIMVCHCSTYAVVI